MPLSCSKQTHIQSLSVVELRLNELFFWAMLNGEPLGCACRHARGHVYTFPGQVHFLVAWPTHS